VEAQEVKKGAPDRKAIYYVQCGKEPDKDVACCVTLDYEPQTGGESRWIRLPYDLNSSDVSKASAISPDSARAAAKERWNTLLAKGAEFTSGVSHLDNIYKTSLINLFLMRTKYSWIWDGKRVALDRQADADISQICVLHVEACPQP
jgi:hypothetical protein